MKKKSPVRMVDLEGLLKTKQTARSKDAGDRLILDRALAGQQRRQNRDR